MGLILLALWASVGAFITHKATMQMKYHWHRKYTLTNPKVESYRLDDYLFMVVGMAMGLFAFGFFIMNASIIGGNIDEQDKKDALNCKAGEVYYKADITTAFQGVRVDRA